MNKRHYKSDLCFVLRPVLPIRLPDGTQEMRPVDGWPTHDWVARLRTSSRMVVFTASSIGGVLTNCINDGGRIRITGHNHGLPPGRLECEFTAYIPSDHFADGVEKVVAVSALDITLTKDAPLSADLMEVEMLMPYIRGRDALEYAADAGYEGTAEQFGEDLAAVSTKEDAFTVTDDLAMSADRVLSVTERAKRALFDDLWREAAGTYGDVDHSHTEDGTPAPYLLNGLWLTYEEAMAVYDVGAIASYDARYRYGSAPIRTNLPPKCEGTLYGCSAGGFDALFLLKHNKTIEVLNLKMRTQDFDIATNARAGTDAVIVRCPKLREIIGTICLGRFSSYGIDKHLFQLLPALRSVRITYLRGNLDLSECPKLDATSIKYLVDRAIVAADKTATVTVHADVYAQIIDESEVGELSPDYEERQTWLSILPAAQKKNIVFACA